MTATGKYSEKNIIYAEKVKDPDASSTSQEDFVYAHPSVARNNGKFNEQRLYKTIYHGFYHGWNRAKAKGDSRLLGYRVRGEGPYKWMDYKEVENICNSISTRFYQLGLKRGDMVGIYSRTRTEWMLTFIACHFRSLTVVPLYDTLGDDSILHILKQTKFKVVIVSLVSEVNKLMNLWDKSVKIKHIVLIDWPSVEFDGADKVDNWNHIISEQIIPKGVTCESFQQFISSVGKDEYVAHDPPEPSDILEICYTSGTTGKPKGAVYHHDRMVTECLAIYKFLYDTLDRTPFESMLCYLPLAHSYELAVECFCVMSGFKLGYFNGDARKILDDIQSLQPTILTAVPRVLTRIHEGIESKTSRQEAGVMRSLLFKLALRQKMTRQSRGSLQDNYMDKLFFKKIHALLGGKLKCVFVGSSATNPWTLKVLRATLGVSVCEGYGQTECYGVSFVQLPNDNSTRCIGAPLSNIFYKVIDVPHLNYFASNNEGELCIKGHSTITEYYKNPEETAKARDKLGWIHTGDVARINVNGTVSIIDRVKELFKLAQGEFVIPTKVESVYAACSEIENVFIWGDPMKTCCIALVFPHMDNLTAAMKKANIPVDIDRSQLNKSKPVKDMLMKLMEKQALHEGLKGFEKAKNIYITPKSLMDYPDLLTPTMKYKRHAIAKYFEREIALMYESIVDKPL